MKKFSLLFLFSLSLITYHLPLLNAATRTSGVFLLRAPSARPLSLAEAYTSVGADLGGVTALHYNPASNSFLKRREISLTGYRGVVDDTYGAFFLGVPTDFGSFGGNLLYNGVDEIELVDTSGVSRKVKAEQDFVAALSYAGEPAELLGGAFGTGISAKFIQSKLVDELNATAVAADLGLQARFFQRRVSFGLSGTNIGSPLKYGETDENLPLTVRAGASYLAESEEYGRALLSVDGVKEREENWKGFFGVSLLWRELIGFQIGYKSGQKKGALSTGFGFQLSNLRIDYALTDNGDIGLSHTASLAYSFGRISER